MDYPIDFNFILLFLITMYVLYIIFILNFIYLRYLFNNFLFILKFYTSLFKLGCTDIISLNFLIYIFLVTDF